MIIILESATTEISSLNPSTKYSLRCIAVPYESDLPNTISKEYLFSTNPGNCLFILIRLISSFCH